MSETGLRVALAAIATARTQARVREALVDRAASPIDLFWELPRDKQDAIAQESGRLAERGIDVMFCTDPDFPEGLYQRGRPIAPLLFYLGNRTLFGSAGIGMCGSRHASDLGLKAAAACGDEVRHQGMTVISGYAAGVDTATHLAALKSGGRTVIVLAEGIDHFRVKAEFSEEMDLDRVLVVSQFPPSQPWAAHAAMSRNRVIYGLGRALVVVEAGPKGGTLAAGEGALALGKAVFVLNFGSDTPEGNASLLARGGTPVASRADLGRLLREINNAPPSIADPPALFPRHAFPLGTALVRESQTRAL